MKVAIPHWQGRISPLFDAADTLLLIDIEDGREVKRDNFNLSRRDPLRRAREVSRLGADMLLCGAVSRELETALLGAGVQVVGFICGEVDGVIAAFLGGTLSHSRFQMPGWEKERPGAARPGRVKRRGKRPPDQRSTVKR
jgi:predicted Fe-Mo cluster-binding NifX family protein